MLWKAKLRIESKCGISIILHILHFLTALKSNYQIGYIQPREYVLPLSISVILSCEKYPTN